MSGTNPLSLAKHFFPLRDPRRKHRRRHRLLDIITIAFCAVVCGCDTWPQIEAFGRRRLEWLRRFLPLANGVPSHDTFERVFDRLDPLAFAACFRSWARAVSGALGLGHIAVDGKTLCGSADANSPLGPLHLVSAWATQQHLSLGSVAVDGKSNEITAIPKLLELLDLHGALVSIDAMGCQKEIARQIIAGGGDYVLTVKGNQPHLLEDIHHCFEEAIDKDFVGVAHESYETTEQAHGRHEYRCYMILSAPQGIRHQEEWEKLQVVGMCYSERTVQGQTSSEVRYFIGSRRASARVYGQALRGHWGIENNLHWQLDVSFGEDACRVCSRNGAQNLASLRRMALALLKRHPGKGSIVCKRLEAALDPSYLEEILLAGSANLEKA